MGGVAATGAATAIGRLSAPANTVRRPSASIRTAISAPTRLRLCARSWPNNRLLSGKPDFGLGRAGHDGTIRITHDDVTQAQRRAALLVAFELRTADEDSMIAAEVFLDGGFQPRCCNVQLDRSA